MVAPDEPDGYAPPGDDVVERTVEPESYRGEATTDRPLGVTGVAAVYALGALLALAGGLVALWNAVTVSGVSAAARGYGVLVALVTLVLAGVAGAVARGLWVRYRSAWSLALFVSGLGVFFGVVGVLFGTVATSFALVVVNAVIVWYLLTPTVREWFAAPGKPRTLHIASD